MAKTRWADVTLLIAVSYVASFQVGKVPPSIPLLRTELGVTGVTAGWVLAIFSVMAATCGIAFGRLADRLGRRRTAALGFVTLAVASAAGAAAPSIPVLLVTRVVEGLGFIALAVAIPPLIAALVATPADRRVALAWWSSYMPLGNAIVFLAAPFILGAGGWRLLWTCTAAGAALAALAIVLRIPAGLDPPPARESLWSGARTVIAARAPLVAGIAFGAYAGTYFIIVGFLPTILFSHGSSVAVAALLTTIVAVTNGIGNIAAGIASRRFSRTQVQLAGAALMGLGGAIEYLPGVPAAVRVAAAALGAGVGGLIPGTITAAVPRLAPEPRLIATTQGVVLQCSNIGQLIGPVVVAALGAAAGGIAGSIVVLTFAAIGIAAALVLRADPPGY